MQTSRKGWKEKNRKESQYHTQDRKGGKHTFFLQTKAKKTKKNYTSKKKKKILLELEQAS